MESAHHQCPLQGRSCDGDAGRDWGEKRILRGPWGDPGVNNSLFPVEMRVPGPQEQGCVQGLPFPAWDIVTAEEPQAQAERPNSQHFKNPPWKLFGCWRPGLFLDALGRSVFLLLCSRDEQRAQLPACTEPAPLPWQHPHELCALSCPLPELPRVGINP